jgi:hypothetical protein
LITRTARMQLTDPERITKPTGGETSDLMNRSSSSGDKEQKSSEAKSLSLDDGNAPQEPKRLGFVPVLKNRNFLTLWSGQVFSQLADKIYLVLMIAFKALIRQSADGFRQLWLPLLSLLYCLAR